MIQDVDLGMNERTRCILENESGHTGDKNAGVGYMKRYLTYTRLFKCQGLCHALVNPRPLKIQNLIVLSPRPSLTIRKKNYNSSLTI